MKEKKSEQEVLLKNNYTWLTVKEVALLLDKESTTIQKMCRNGKCICRKVASRGRGGEKFLIALESFTESIQEEFFKNEELTENKFLNSLTAKEREKIFFKYKVVKEYIEFSRYRHSEGRMNAFLEKFNKENPATTVNRCNVSQWVAKYNQNGLSGLYDSRGTHKRGTSTVPKEAWDTFYSIWFNTKGSVQQCYEMTCEKHKNDFDHMPSIYSFRRKLNEIPMSAKEFRNNGRKALDDKYMPHIKVNYESMYSNMQWIADHHEIDVMVEDEKGKIFRPWLSAWIDRKSRYIVGYEVNSCEPNSDIVLRSFAKACAKCGIPDSVELDNGKDFKAYDLFNNENGMSVARQMGIKVTNAIVKNAKAKPIERTFRTMEEKYFALVPSYIAGKPHLRPEKMNMTNKKLKQKGLCMPYDEFLETMDLIVKEMNNAKHTGDGMDGMTPYEVYTSNFVKPVRVIKDEDVMILLFQRTSRPIKVGRNGIRVPAIGYWFDSDKLIEYAGKEVFARYNSDDVSKVYVFTTDDRFICTAYCNELAELGTTASIDLIREYNRRKKERREKLKEFMPGKDYYTIQEYLASRKETYQEFDASKANSMFQLVPVKHKHMEEIRREEDEIRRQKETEKQATKPIQSIDRKQKVDDALYQFMRKIGG